MTAWTVLKPRARGAYRMTEPTVSAHLYGGSYRTAIRLPALLCEKMLWKRGMPMEIASSQETGITRLRLRLARDGQGYRLSAVSKSSALALAFTPSPYALEKMRPAQTVKHVITEEGLILTVPAWAAIGDPPLPARKDAA